MRQDWASIRDTLRRVRRSDRLAPLNLFGRRNPIQMLDYLERRAGDRSSVQIPIYLSPVDFDGQCVTQIEDVPGAIQAFTKDVSLRGVGFTHDDSLPGHFAIVTFDLMNEQFVSLLLEVRWSNHREDGTYLSGGRFVGIVG